VEVLAEETGFPVGIKSAVGDMKLWGELTQLMADTERGVDFVNIGGGENGTVRRRWFTDSVALPFWMASAGSTGCSDQHVGRVTGYTQELDRSRSFDIADVAVGPALA
jgi:hypothetical protein